MKGEERGERASDSSRLPNGGGERVVVDLSHALMKGLRLCGMNEEMTRATGKYLLAS